MIKIMKKYLSVPLLLILFSGCGELWKLVPIEPGSKPVITDSFAPQKVKPGTGWKIFLAAEDKDGDMKDIVISISPAAQSILTYSFAPIREEERGSLTGYLLIKTSPSPYLLDKIFHLSLSIRDKTERKSDTVGFLLSFTSDSDGELPEKWRKASQNRLAIIFLDYFNNYLREFESSRE
jgi:hypothetical protein